MIALKDDKQQSEKQPKWQTKKIPKGGVVTLTHSLDVYNSAINPLLFNWIELFFSLSCTVQLLTVIKVGSRVLF